MFGLKIFVRVQTFRRVPPVLPRNFCHPVQKNAEAEGENLAHLKDLDELEICYDVDGGGGRFVCEFAFINNIDRKITL